MFSKKLEKIGSGKPSREQGKVKPVCTSILCCTKQCQNSAEPAREMSATEESGKFIARKRPTQKRATQQLKAGGSGKPLEKRQKKEGIYMSLY